MTTFSTSRFGFLRLALLGFAAFVLSSCYTSMEGVNSSVTSSTLHTTHITFIDKYTVAGPDHPAALPDGFEADVSARMQKFDAAVASAKRTATREKIFVNDRQLFAADVALVRQQHYFSPAGARHAKALVDRNYLGNQ